MTAARALRRAPVAMVAPALIDAVSQHADGYVRFRALVLLSGMNDPRTRDVMVQALASPNDRLRAAGYAYFEHNADPQLVPRMLGALPTESSETVRPALTRTLAAYGTDPRVRDALNGLVLKGQDFFRSAVIESIGDYKGAYALPSLIQVAKQDGPLQDDAVLAIGKIGDKKSVETLASLQRTAPRSVQPTIAAAICLLAPSQDLDQTQTRPNPRDQQSERERESCESSKFSFQEVCGNVVRGHSTPLHQLIHPSNGDLRRCDR